MLYAGDDLSRETTAYVEHFVMPAIATGKEYGTLFGHGQSSVPVIKELSWRILNKNFTHNEYGMVNNSQCKEQNAEFHYGY